jgi:hypothetical protein
VLIQDQSIVEVCGIDIEWRIAHKTCELQRGPELGAGLGVMGMGERHTVQVALFSPDEQSVG